MTMVKNHLFVPGKVESWNVIIEANNMSLWSLTSYMDVILHLLDVFIVCLDSEENS